MKKALRKLIPALVMLLIAAAFVGTSTYAWFSMNRIVDVTGMSVTTEVTDSLLIAGTNTESAYGKTLEQSRVGRLRPVSTVDGVNFFYTESQYVRGDGSTAGTHFTAYTEATSLSNSTAGKDAYSAGFQTAYGVTDSITASNVLYGYIDYVFYIKATNTTGSAEDLKLTKLNLLYNNQAIGTEKAWRVAVFDQAATASTAPTTGATILAIDDAENYVNDPSNQAVSSTTTPYLANVSYTPASDWAVASVAAGQTEYHKVTVRLWLEGEDSTCNNETFATLTSAYTLSLQFVLGGDEDPVTEIGSVVPVVNP